MLKFPVTLSLIILAWTFSYGQREVDPSLETPYHTILTHLHYLQSDSYRPGIAAMVINEDDVQDSLVRVKRAVQLKKIMDGKGLFVRLNQLPRKANYLDSTSGEHYFTPFPKRMPDIYLERIDTLWYYSSETVAKIPSLYKSVYPLGVDKLLSLFPKWGDHEFLGLKVWQYVSMVIMLLVAYLIFLLFKILIRPLINKAISKYTKNLPVEPKTITGIVRVISLYLIVWILKIFLPSLLLPVKVTELIQKGLSIALTVIIALFLFRLIEILSVYFERMADKTDHKMDDQAHPIIERILKIVVVIGAVFQILNLMNVNVTALIAGISIGGLALALAAQDTVKNLIGSIMIFIDRPFQIDDYVAGADFEGTIKEVGFRSTRIQKIDTSIVAVPNGQLANMLVTNYGVRFFRMMNIKLGVTYDTPADVIEAFTRGLKRIKDIHPMVSDEPFFIHFTDMADSSLQILFRVYIDTRDYAEELKIKEELNLSILRLAEALGISFAFPSSSVYVESTPDNPLPKWEFTDESLEERANAFFEDFTERYGASEDEADNSGAGV